MNVLNENETSEKNLYYDGKIYIQCTEMRIKFVIIPTNNNIQMNSSYNVSNRCLNQVIMHRILG